MAQRGRTIDTFTAKHLAKGSRTILNNTKTYRALKGDTFPEVSTEDQVPENDPVAILYRKCQEQSE